MEEGQSGDPPSLEYIRSRDLYPLKTTVTDDSSISQPFVPLHGEGIEYIGRTSQGVVALSSYRLHIRNTATVINVPLALIDSIECRDIFFLYIFCKDAQSFRVVFDTNDSCMEWYKRLNGALNQPLKLNHVFAYAFFAWGHDESPTCAASQMDPTYQLCQPAETRGYSFDREVERMNFDLKKSWRICYANVDFKVSPTYPRLHILPATINDKEVETIAAFRSTRRFPSVVWRDTISGAVIARSSQPEVGWLGWRSPSDEALLQAIADACKIKPVINGKGHQSQSNSLESTNGVADPNKSQMVIVDARSYAAAVANRAKGGGCECAEYYQNCEIQFMNLANIHSIRKSFQALRTLIATQADQASWLSQLEGTKWLQYLSGLMRSAIIVTNTISIEKRPVLVHCSDGWDRTPQITALAQICLDSYYRTIEGFRVLVEREWLEFGHKFADRCALGIYSDDTNERCPVFLQFLDCVHQILKQFPCAFQFNQAFLVKLVQHTYSCLFGDFLCNKTRERLEADVTKRTATVWSLLRPSNTKFRNYLYTPTNQVLRPSYNLRQMEFWSAVYFGPSASTWSLSTQPQESATPEGSDVSDNEATSSLSKTRSCDDIVKAIEAAASTPVTRRLSDPNIAIEGLKDSNHEVNHVLNIQSNNTVPSKPAADVDEASSLRLADPHTKTPADKDIVSEDEPENRFEVSNLVGGKKDEVLENASSKTFDSDISEEASDSGLLRKCANLNANDAVISGSTDTLTGDLAAHGNDSSSVGGQERTLHQKSHIPLDQSSTISTSTTELSDSHVNNLQHRRRCRETTPVANGGEALSLAIPDAYSSSCGPNCGAQKLRELSLSHGASGHESSHHPSDLDHFGSRSPGTLSPLSNGNEQNWWMSSLRQAGGFSQRLDCDGLMTWLDAGQSKMAAMESEYNTRLEQMQRMLQQVKMMHCGSSMLNNAIKDQDTGNADSNEPISGGGSDLSWENLEENDANMTLWVPDHAVTHCAGCSQEFWMICRRHHCRNCGKIFCNECTKFMVPVPTQQLNNPVRVCHTCYHNLQPDYYAKCNGDNHTSCIMDGEGTLYENGAAPTTD